MRNTLAQVAFLFAMALVAVAMFNTNPAQAELIPQFLMSEEACLDRGESPEFCAHLAVPLADTETVTETDSDAKAEEPTVWVPRSEIPVWREVPLSQVPGPQPITGPEAGNMIVWDFNPEACSNPHAIYTGHRAREMAAQDATVLRSLAATLAQAQADMAWSLTESSQTHWLYDSYYDSLGTLTTMSTDLAGDITYLDRVVLSFPDTNDQLHGRDLRRAQAMCKWQGEVLNAYSGLWLDVGRIMATLTQVSVLSGDPIDPWRASAPTLADARVMRAGMVMINDLLPPPAECLDALDRRLRDMGVGDCVDK